MNTESRRASQIETPPPGSEPPQRDFNPKPLTLGQNVVLTLKVIGGAAILGSLLWLLERSNN